MAPRDPQGRRRLGLAALLVGLNATLVLAAVVGVAVAALRLLERLADEQALARVELAGTGARQAVERSAGDVRTSARLLGERPTVGRLLAAGGDPRGLAVFLDRFGATSGLSGCAILAGGRLLASGGAADLPWGQWAGLPGAGDWQRRRSAHEGAEQGQTGPLPPGTEPRRAANGEPAFVAAPGGGLLLVAASPVVSSPGATAVVALRLDAAFARRIAGQTGLPVAVLSPAEALAKDDDPRRALREQALDGAAAAAGRVDAAGLYLAVQPLAAPGGGAAALVETALPTAAVAASLARLERNLLLLSLAVAALAVLSGFAISRRLARPVRELTAAAARIGGGDLATPMPRAPGAELGTLAATMEEMRRRLLRLTSELRRRQAEGEAILTGISEGVFGVDRDRRIRYLNPQAAALLGVTPAAALGRFCGDVLHPEPVAGVRPCEEQCPIVHARFRGATRATERLLLADGSRRAVLIASSPPAEEQQFQVLRDETEVEAARRLRDAVLANISHEFKTPLSAQLASIELLRERLRGARGDDPETAALVLALERGSLRLTQLIDNLLESVRIESGQDSLRSRPVALDEVVEEAVELTAPLVAQRGQRIEVDLPYPLPAVSGDAPRLTQVFVNLLANANKFAPAGSTIRVGGAVEESAVALWVEDEGPGLPASPAVPGASEEDRSLFARFVRSRGGEEPEQSGMGLGLWIVQSIVERHGGAVEARREGAATRLLVTLPRAAAGVAA
jgi:signal transduction histidine kinase